MKRSAVLCQCDCDEDDYDGCGRKRVVDSLDWLTEEQGPLSGIRDAIGGVSDTISDVAAAIEELRDATTMRHVTVDFNTRSVYQGCVDNCEGNGSSMVAYSFPSNPNAELFDIYLLCEDERKGMEAKARPLWTSAQTRQPALDFLYQLEGTCDGIGPLLTRNAKKYGRAVVVVHGGYKNIKVFFATKREETTPIAHVAVKNL